MSYLSCDHFSDDEVHEWLDKWLCGFSREFKLEALQKPVWCGECINNINSLEKKNFDRQKEFQKMSTILSRYKTQNSNLKKKLKGIQYGNRQTTQ